MDTTSLEGNTSNCSQQLFVCGGIIGICIFWFIFQIFPNEHKLLL